MPTRRAFLSAFMLAGAPAPDRRTTVRFVPAADLSGLDPIATTAYSVRTHGFMVFDTLYAPDRHLAPRPQMVESEEVSADGLVWTLRLRSGLQFHDGAPVRAADCIASIKRWASKSGYGGELLKRTEALDAVDARTLRFRLSRPFPLLPAALGTATSPVPFMMPERLAQTDAATPVREAIGSGPFRFLAEEWRPGERAVWQHFDGYVPRDEAPDGLAGGKRVHVDYVEWRIIPDPSTTLAALKAGEVDWMEVLPPDLLPLAQGRPALVVDPIDPAGVSYFLRFNTLFPPFDDTDARLAVMLAIDQTAIAFAIAGDSGLARPCADAFPCGTPYSADIGAAVMTGDLDAARAKLALSGYDGRTVTLIVPDETTFAVVGEVVAARLRQLGIATALERLDAASFFARRASQRPPNEGGWNLFPAAAAASDFANPAANVLMRGNGKAGWPGWVTDAEMERLRAAWFEAADSAARDGVAAEMGRHVFRTAPFVPLAQVQLPSVHRAALQGVVAAPAAVFWGLRKA